MNPESTYESKTKLSGTFEYMKILNASKHIYYTRKAKFLLVNSSKVMCIIHVKSSLMHAKTRIAFQRYNRRPPT